MNFAQASALFFLLLTSCSAPQPKEQPNVIIFTLDTFRADRLGTYGNTNNLTKYLDEFAAKSTVFENAITPIGTTLPAHASIFTGLFPGEHGVLWNGDSLDPKNITLAEILGESGYTTAAFVSSLNMICRGGLEQGFKYSDKASKELSCESGVRSGGETNKVAQNWLGNINTKRPIFLWIHYFETHAPYPLTPYAKNIFNNIDYNDSLKNGASVEQFYSYNSTKRPHSEETSIALSSLYDGSVIEVDNEFENMISLLKEKKILDNAIVIVVADHGQSLGEHNFVGHGGITEEIIKIPFFIWQSNKTKNIQRIKNRVSLIDIFPTMVELLNLDNITTDSLPGASLVPLLTGESVPERVHYSEKEIPNPNTDTKDINQVAVYSQDFKFWSWNGGEVLFNIKDDPMEQMPINIRNLSNEMIENYRNLAKMHKKRERPNIERKPTPIKIIKELKSLGYIK